MVGYFKETMSINLQSVVSSISAGKIICRFHQEGFSAGLNVGRQTGSQEGWKLGWQQGSAIGSEVP